MRAIPSPLKTLFARGLLALALLFAQQTAALHWLSHAVEATHAKAGLPAPGEHCDECVALAGLGAAAASTAPLLPTSFAQHALHARLPAATSPAAPWLAYHSRAPPILS
ncbi:MAG: hypothetical protein ABI702_09260 [Burkholderiales bacterium]